MKTKSNILTYRGVKYNPDNGIGKNNSSSRHKGVYRGVKVSV